MTTTLKMIVWNGIKENNVDHAPSEVDMLFEDAKENASVIEENERLKKL